MQADWNLRNREEELTCTRGFGEQTNEIVTLYFIYIDNIWMERRVRKKKGNGILFCQLWYWFLWILLSNQSPDSPPRVLFLSSYLPAGPSLPRDQGLSRYCGGISGVIWSIFGHTLNASVGFGPPADRIRGL